MFLDTNTEVIQTSEGQTFRAESVYKVNLKVYDVEKLDYIQLEKDGLKQKVFYNKHYMFGDEVTDYTFENNDLGYLGSTKQNIEILIEKRIDLGTLFRKTAVFEIFDKNSHELGIHKFIMEKDDLLYLLAQWAIISEDLNNFSKNLVKNTSSKRI